MNKIEIEGGGFPGTSKTWRFVRDMINEVHVLATAIGGDTYIASGVNVVNSVASAGIIVYQGEVLPFAGGAVTQRVVIKEDRENVTYLKDDDSDGQADEKTAYFERYAEFIADGVNTGLPVFNFSILNPITPLKEVTRRLPPTQVPYPYWGSISSIKEGWQLCDGSNGTPDLRSMFIVGYDPNDTDYNSQGKTGGEKRVTLTEAQMPSHNHSGSTSSNGNHAHSVPNESGGGGSGVHFRIEGFNRNRQTGSYAGNHTHSLTISNKGGGQSHENRPPYYTMAYIAYVG